MCISIANYLIKVLEVSQNMVPGQEATSTSPCISYTRQAFLMIVQQYGGGRAHDQWSLSESFRPPRSNI